MAKVGDGPTFVEAVVAYRPDVSVVDVRMPPTQGDEDEPSDPFANEHRVLRDDHAERRSLHVQIMRAATTSRTPQGVVRGRGWWRRAVVS